MKKNVLLCINIFDYFKFSNIMKKFLFSIVAALLSVPTFAQFGSGDFSLSESSIYWGVRMGANIANISGDKPTDFGSKTGINLGGVVGLRLSHSTPIFLESGLYYTERGSKKDTKNKIGLTYLEIPILMKYGLQATDDIAILPFIGPYFSLGFAGKSKWEANGTRNSKGSYSSDAINGGFNHADMGFKLGCGAEWNMIYLEAGYQIGVANIAKQEEYTSHGNALFINIGVNF